MELASKVVTVVSVDENPLTHLFVEKALEEIDFALFLSHTYSNQEFIELIKRTRPDVAIIDLEMSGIDGFASMLQTRQYHPELKVIFLSQYSTSGFVKAAMKCDANAFLLKMPSIARLRRTLIQVMNGEFVLDSSIAKYNDYFFTENC